MNTESPSEDRNPDRFDNVATTRIRDVLDRVGRLADEKQALADDIKEVYAEAKGIGLCAKTLRTLHRLERMDGEKRREEEELLDLYKAALNMP